MDAKTAAIVLDYISELEWLAETIESLEVDGTELDARRANVPGITAALETLKAETVEYTDRCTKHSSPCVAWGDYDQPLLCEYVQSGVDVNAESFDCVWESVAVAPAS